MNKTTTRSLSCVFGFHTYVYGPKYQGQREGQFHKSVLQDGTCSCCGKINRIVIK